MAPRRGTSQDRAGDILAAAARLFRERGVKSVSIDEIAQGAGIAKGTFYLYFKTKDDLLAKLAELVVEHMVQAAETAGRADSRAIDRFCAAVLAMQSVDRSEHYLADALNHLENSGLHELTNRALVRRMAPVLAAIVDQGQRDGDFNVEDAQATLEFLLAGQAALLGGGGFQWSPAEHAARLRATFIIIERSLGAPVGALVERFSALGIGREGRD